MSQGSYGNGKTEFEDFSRTIPGLFSFFKDSISSQFCITAKKCIFNSRKRRSGNRKKAHLFSLILISVIKNGITAQIE